MTKWKVGALILVATLIPALTAAVVMADLPPDSRLALIDTWAARSSCLRSD